MELDWSDLEVEAISWGLDEELESPTWEDLERVIDRLETQQSAAIRLDDLDANQPPTLILGREAGGWSITFKSDAEDLWPAKDLYDTAGCKRIARLFFDERRLDAADDWRQP
jgi:hypothetical protein